MPKALRAELLDIARTLAVAGLIALLIRTMAVEPFYIPSSSMEPGLITGDYILVSKASYGWSRASLPFNLPLFKRRIGGRAPRRGEVVVFRHPRDPSETLIKRVVGLPGDHIRVAGGQVVVNGAPYRWEDLGVGHDRDDPGRQVEAVRETQTDGKSYFTFDAGSGLPGDDRDEIVVPADSYFMMGDNRDNSLDSRWPIETGVGFVPAENLEGRARVILFSWGRDAKALKPWTWRIKFDRLFRPIA
ncbi:MAG: signal peptidase [Caulobacteraceae bacterium]|nr:signal peptidase [Caulobacteraceae bacterium]